MPEPERFGGDLEFHRPRFRADPSAAFIAERGAGASQRFEGLLAACEAFAASRGLERVVAGVSTARSEAYGRMLRGLTTFLQGVAMHRPNDPRYHRPDAFVMDWR
jgi:hypothetical protein